MVELVDNKRHDIIKRDGRIESFDEDKLYAVILWACKGRESLAKTLLEAISIKIHNKMSIVKLYDEVINTASNLISDLYPVWDEITRNLYILKLHKDIGVKRIDYPSYKDIVANNIKHGYYSEETFNKLLTHTTIEELESKVLDPMRDNLFTFGGLKLFVDKYCNKTPNGTLLELPQHVYLRDAIQKNYHLSINEIKEDYDQVSSHLVTDATPKMVNGCKPNAQLFSCCLARPEDSLESLNKVDDILGNESKFGGGLATDISAVRAKGAFIKGNKGKSGGAIPFVQKNQWAVGAYNQGDTRMSSEAMYYNWFHYEAPELTMLKDKSGKDEERARKLKYAIKWTKRFSRAIKNDEEIYLFDPHKTQDMTYAWGEELDRLYDQYSKTQVRKRTYRAQDLAFTVAKIKGETGNNYTFFTDNANIQNIGGGTVTQSNLCMEYLPNFKSIKHLSDELVTVEGKTFVQHKFEGDVALCNLASINLAKWILLSPEEKRRQAYILVRSMDNSIDNSFYSNRYGRHHSFQHRNIGIGVSNYANVIALQGFLWDSKEARQFTHELFEELQYYCIAGSVKLASERGKYPLFHESKWSKGVFPHEISILGNMESELNYPLKMDWEALRVDLIKYGIRNEYLMAIAPTATSGLCINATPGVDLPRKLKTIQEGTYSLPFIVPNLRECRPFYRTTFQVANKDTIELAAIRQKFICMGQSVSLGYPKLNSAYEVIDDIMYAEHLGLKTLYYTYVPAADDLSDDDDAVCESCQS